MGRKKGICTLCGKGGKLSFEHVPPRASGNVPGVKMFGLDDWLERDPETGAMVGGKVQPEGTGVLGACEECNGFLGREYVPAFIKFADAGRELLADLGDPRPYDAEPNATYLQVGIAELDRLAVAKQIVSMLLMTSGRSVAEQHPDLVRFVLDPDAQGLPPRYRLFLGMSPGPMARSTGLTASVNTETGERVILIELVYPPYAYALTLNGTAAYEAGEITDWTLAAKGERVTILLGVPLGFAHTAYPGDLRSRAEIRREERQEKGEANPEPDRQVSAARPLKGPVIVAAPNAELDETMVKDVLREMEEAGGKPTQE